MSRARKAAVIAAFGYVQFGVAIVTGLFLVPLTLHSLGPRTWGLWLASSEVLGYAGMVDLGVLAVLPWLLAEADGRRNRAESSNLVSQGVWLGCCVGVVYAAVALGLWQLLPSKMFLTPADRNVVDGPLTVLVLATAITYPLNAYRALLAGMQDVFFNGAVITVQNVVGAVLMAVLLLRGYGLYALVAAVVGPSLIAHVVYAVRAAAIAPDIVWRFSRPEVATLRMLFTNGIGSWLGGLGWQLLAASNGIVITYMGHPEWVPVYACTAKLGAMCTQLTWVLPDSGHIGLAQLHGERTSTPRVRAVVLMMQRLHLLMAGAVACGLLAFNPSFVTRWVGAPLFGGLGLNALLAVGVILASFTHGLITSASIVGNRRKVGLLVLVNGIVQVPLAIVLGHRLGLIGVAWATVVAACITSLPGAIALLRPTISLGARGLVTEIVTPWATRILPFAAVAALIGAGYESLGLWLSAVAATLLCAAYAWHMRTLAAELPLNARVTQLLVRFRLLPPVLPATAAAVAAGNGK
jgi:O-antigen/teichoic acid export membrane protein